MNKLPSDNTELHIGERIDLYSVVLQITTILNDTCGSIAEAENILDRVRAILRVVYTT